jgi:hypothetical protein
MWAFIAEHTGMNAAQADKPARVASGPDAPR